MYELGLRHSRDLLTIQIGQAGRLPFDLSVIRTIQFMRTESGLVDLRNQLEEILKAGLRGDFDSVTATRLWHETEPQPPDAINRSAQAGVNVRAGSASQGLDSLCKVGIVLLRRSDLAPRRWGRHENGGHRSLAGRADPEPRDPESHLPGGPGLFRRGMQHSAFDLQRIQTLLATRAAARLFDARLQEAAQGSLARPGDRPRGPFSLLTKRAHETPGEGAQRYPMLRGR